jgi:hypothetical protein
MSVEDSCFGHDVRQDCLLRVWCFVSVLGAFLKRAFCVHEGAHVGVCVVQPPGAYPKGGFQSEVFPGPPDAFHPDQGFGVFVPFGAPGERCALVDFADVGLGQQLDEELHGAGVDQLLAVAAACGLNLFVPELFTHALSPSVQGLCAGTAIGSR